MQALSSWNLLSQNLRNRENIKLYSSNLLKKTVKHVRAKYWILCLYWQEKTHWLTLIALENIQYAKKQRVIVISGKG